MILTVGTLLTLTLFIGWCDLGHLLIVNNDSFPCTYIMDNLLCFNDNMRLTYRHEGVQKGAYVHYLSAVKSLESNLTGIRINSRGQDACARSAELNLTIPIYNMSANPNDIDSQKKVNRMHMPVVFFQTAPCGAKNNDILGLGNVIGFYYDLLGFSVERGVAVMLDKYSGTIDTKRCPHRATSEAIIVSFNIIYSKDFLCYLTPPLFIN